MGEPLRHRLQTALRVALKDRDKAAVDAIRSVLAAIDNAEAVDAKPASTTAPTSSHIAGAVSGAGAAEAARRELSEDDVRAIVRAEVRHLRSNADEYQRLGKDEDAARLRAQADVLDVHLSV
jgi:hypothetical protein